MRDSRFDEVGDEILPLPAKVRLSVLVAVQSRVKKGSGRFSPPTTVALVLAILNIRLIIIPIVSRVGPKKDL